MFLYSAHRNHHGNAVHPADSGVDVVYVPDVLLADHRPVPEGVDAAVVEQEKAVAVPQGQIQVCLLYTSDAADE